MPIYPDFVEVKTILDLPPIVPPAAGTPAYRQNLFFGVDTTHSGLASLRLNLDQLRHLLTYEESSQYRITVNSHGQPPLVNQVPRPFRFNAGVIVAANTASLANLPIASIVGIPNSNTLLIQTSGGHKVNAHGFAIGELLYLQDNGTLSYTSDVPIPLPVLVALTATDLLLLPLSTRTGGAGLELSRVQSVAATSWVITHDFGYYPHVSVTGTTGEVVEGAVTHQSINQLTVTFSVAFAGTARLR